MNRFFYFIILSTFLLYASAESSPCPLPGILVLEYLRQMREQKQRLVKATVEQPTNDQESSAQQGRGTACELPDDFHVL